MKTKFFICVLFLLINNKSFSQYSYEVVYGISEAKIKKPLYNVDKRSKELVNQIVEYTKNINYILVAQENESLFKQEKLMLKDDNPLNSILLKGALRFTSFNKVTYIDFNKDSLVFVKNLVEKDFTVKRDIQDFNWILTKDKKEILGFNARKAKGSYFNHILGKELNVEAWYIPSIPLQCGPDIFVGLPGLIAEVHLERAVVSVKSIKKKNNLEIEKIEIKNGLSQKEFEQTIKKLTEEFINN